MAWWGKEPWCAEIRILLIRTPRPIPLLLILLLWLLASLLLILSSLNTRTCLSSIVHIMDADGMETQRSILSFQYQEVVVKIQIHFVSKMNLPQQDMQILCLPCTSINSTDYTCKCILFLNNWFEIIIVLAYDFYIQVLDTEIIIICIHPNISLCRILKDSQCHPGKQRGSLSICYDWPWLMGRMTTNMWWLRHFT